MKTKKVDKWEEFRTPTKEKDTSPDDYDGNFKMLLVEGRHMLEYPWGQKVEALLPDLFFWKKSEIFRKYLDKDFIIQYCKEVSTSDVETKALLQYCQIVLEAAEEETKTFLAEEKNAYSLFRKIP
jgi:hypothetical protein